MVMVGNTTCNVINHSFIDYIIKCYVPELQTDEKYKKINLNLFKEAMLHISTKIEDHQKTYERLEYFGDFTFHMIITEYLYKRYDEENEGFLTRLRIRIERGDSMVELAKILELNQYIQIHGMYINDHILEDVFEAFIGAFYLSFGIRYTKTFVVKLIENHKNLSEIIFYDDNYKDLLLRYYHQMQWGHPIYEDHNPNVYRKFVSVVKNPKGKIIGKGMATSVIKAEQEASKNALITLKVIVNDEIDPDWLSKIGKIDHKGKKNKEKTNKKPMSVYNPQNKLISKDDILEILAKYNVKILKRDFEIKLFQEAMTHRSYLIRKKLTPEDVVASENSVKLQKKSNERLKFLGDSVIHFIVGEYLYHRYQKADEGFLTRLRCKLKNRESLFYLAKQTNISSYILISQNIEVLHGRNNINIIGIGFAAFVGALYLQIGLSVTKQFLLEVIRIEFNTDEIAENETNYKDMILQLYNENHWGCPEYRKLKEEGPDHCKIFTMGIFLNGKLMGQGKASSKRRAEQIASKKMYELFTNKQ